MFTKSEIEKYFIAEKRGSRLFMVIGIGGILLALVNVFILKDPLYKGMAIPMAAFGMVMAIAGITVYSRSDQQCMEMVNAFENDLAKLKNEELPRMKKVMKSFIFYRWMEIILFITGAALYIYFIRDFYQDFWRGFGFGLAIMAGLGFVADYYAEKRGHTYTKGLESFTSNI